MSARRYLVRRWEVEDQLQTTLRIMRSRAEFLPPGMREIDSWIAKNRDACWQLLEVDDPALFHQWRAQWADAARLDITEL